MDQLPEDDGACTLAAQCCACADYQPLARLSQMCSWAVFTVSCFFLLQSAENMPHGREGADGSAEQVERNGGQDRMGRGKVLLQVSMLVFA